MILTDYKAFADRLAREAKVENGLHGYFLAHQQRLWQTASHFDLWNLRDKKILEIGPFFAYTPFILREQGNEVHVVEGDDPAVYPLKPLYQARGIEFKTCEFSQSFGSPEAKRHRFPFDDNQFDVVSCWETMEHFNFNPVGFVRDLHRILKPGGRAYITVPNIAKLENRVKLLLGKGVGTTVDSYIQFYNYEGGVAFLGFHWREYVLAELTGLFLSQKFSIISAGHLLTFQNYDRQSLSKKIKRLAGRTVFQIFPSVGTLCVMTAGK
jgi:SAM-dependent methyltransferase